MSLQQDTPTGRRAFVHCDVSVFVRTFYSPTTSTDGLVNLTLHLIEPLKELHTAMQSLKNIEMYVPVCF